MTDVKTQIDDTVKANDVVLYMKGTKEMPQCGFSSRVAGVLNYMGVEYTDVNVLADENIRQGIKDYSDWPTVPQLYVKGDPGYIVHIIAVRGERAGSNQRVININGHSTQNAAASGRYSLVAGPVRCLYFIGVPSIRHRVPLIAGTIPCSMVLPRSAQGRTQSSYQFLPYYVPFIAPVDSNRH